MDARRGDTPAAVSAVVTAARLAPDDPFVQRTTGQLAAYYDQNAGRVTLPAAVKGSLDDVRKAMATKDIYARAYREASEAYAEGPSDEPVPYAAPYPAPSAPSSAYYDSYYNRAYYPAPYTDPYAYGYPEYAWWPSGWWWGPSVVIVDRPFLFHHRFDHDRFFHHGFDHRFDGNRFDHHFFDGHRLDGKRFDGHRFDGNRFDTRVGFRGSFGHSAFAGNRFNRAITRSVPLRAGSHFGSRSLTGRSSFAPRSFGGARMGAGHPGLRGGATFRGGMGGAGMRGGMRGGMGGGMRGGARGGVGGHR
jgi:hypothetical protein